MLTIGLAFGLAGSAQAADNTSRVSVPGVKQLLGNEYRSIVTRGNPQIKPRAVHLRFYMRSPRPGVLPYRPTVTFRLGCNHLGGKFRIRNGRLFLLGGVGGTAAACENNADRWFVNRMRKSMIVRTVGNRLVLSRPAERIRFVLRAAAHTVDPIWVEPTAPATVEELDGKSFKSVRSIGINLGATASLEFVTDNLNRFEDDVRLTGPILRAHLDCNIAGGEYRIEEDQLLWTDVFQTLMGCPDSRESQFFGFLMRQPEIGFAGTRLVISKGTRQIVFHGA